MSTEFTNRQWRLPNNENKDKQSNYSMDFDSASSDYIDLGNVLNFEYNQAFSISSWINANAVTGTKNIVNKYDSSATRGIAFDIYSNCGSCQNRIDFSISNKNSGSTGSRKVLYVYTSHIIPLNSWNHVCITYDGSSLASGVNIYLNGVPQSFTTLRDTLGNNTILNTQSLEIGGNISFMDGKLDAVSIFNYALTDGTGGTVNQIAALYGSSSTGIGNPMSLSPKPVAMYNLGDKSAFNGANYLVPNIAAEEADGDIATSYSPYALDFDSSSSDYIDCGSFSALNSGTAVTVSLWFKSSTYSTNGRAISNNTIEIYQNSSLYTVTQGRFFYRIRGNSGIPIIDLGGSLASGVGNLVDGNWHHLCVTFNNSTTSAIVYEDGTPVVTNTSVSGTLNSASSNLYIGSSSTSSNFIDGSISNISIWNTALTSSQVTELYNEGVPSNLNNHSAYSNLVSWWQLGSNSSFNTNWTVLDEKGSNNGTSSNMTEADIVDGVGSYANGTSSGMGGDEVIGDAPYSTANALSVNMDVEDRVTDTPS